MDAKTELLLEALAEVMETTAFISLSPLPEETPAIESLLVVTMPIGGACKIHIAAPAALAAAIACNILMLDPGSPEADERGSDALKEILNVTSGLYLSRADWLAGAIPEMQIPQSRAIQGADAVAAWLKSVNAQLALAEENPVAIAIEGGGGTL
jgi:chemotaxis protein CheY-P-specific phosphatase CheC